jgi:hypothetical protein
MACSKLLTEETIDVKVVYEYYGKSRCALLDIQPSVLYTHNLDAFMEFVLEEIPYLRRLQVHRLCFLDEEGTYVDVNDRNFSKFIKSIMSGSSKITVKMLDGTSPSMSRHQQSTVDYGDNLTSRRSLTYSSPAELDIQMKEDEVKVKRTEMNSMTSKYEEIAREMNADVWRDKSKRACHNCHMRVGHDRKKCNMDACENVAVCGEIDLHPEAKKQLTSLSQQKQKLSGEVQSLQNELDAKKGAHEQTFRTFEGQIQSHLIRSNPEKYLIPATGQVRQVRVNADIEILRKVYKGVMPKAADIESTRWPDMIAAYERKLHTTTKPGYCNPVRKELQQRGIIWPDGSDARSKVGATGTTSTSSSTKPLYPTTPAQEHEQLNMAMSMSLMNPVLNTPPFFNMHNFGYYNYPFPVPQYPMSPPLPGVFSPVGYRCPVGARPASATVSSPPDLMAELSESPRPPLPPPPQISSTSSPKPHLPENA